VLPKAPGRWGWPWRSPARILRDGREAKRGYPAGVGSHRRVAGAELLAHPGRRTPRASCCRRCTEPGWARDGSWGCRSSCPHSDRAGRGGDGWKSRKRYSTSPFGSLPEKPELPSRPPKARLYLNVPLSTSWPLRRMWMPSLSREPKAMYSARAQSTVRFFTISPRVFRIRLRPVGTAAGSSPAREGAPATPCLAHSCPRATDCKRPGRRNRPTSASGTDQGRGAGTAGKDQLRRGATPRLSSLQHLAWTHGRVWVGRDLQRSPCPTVPPWAGTPATSPGCSEPRPAWP